MTIIVIAGRGRVNMDSSRAGRVVVPIEEMTIYPSEWKIDLEEMLINIQEKRGLDWKTQESICRRAMVAERELIRLHLAKVNTAAETTSGEKPSPGLVGLDPGDLTRMTIQRAIEMRLECKYHLSRHMDGTTILSMKLVLPPA